MDRLVVIGLIISLVFVIIGTFWFSYSNETLDVIAERFNASESNIWTPLFPDYEIPGFKGNLVMNVFLGAVFTILIFAITLVMGKILKHGND